MGLEELWSYLKINEEVPDQLHQILREADGGYRLLTKLPEIYSPESISTSNKDQRAWELCGLLFLNLGRFHEAWRVFQGLYDRMLEHQEQTRIWVHKGMPLVYISDCHARLRHPVLAKRYLMLTLCEDAISDKGKILPNRGVYFRIVGQHGVPQPEVDYLGKRAWELSQGNPVESLFPEWVLQELGEDWIRDYPTEEEAGIYVLNTRYLKYLFDGLGTHEGKTLERLAYYLLSCIPGCRAYRRTRTESTDYDVVCSLEGPGLDFRDEVGRYFLCECKDWSRPADFTTIAKFARVLESAKCRFGILFSREGITGAMATTDAAREVLKLFQDRGIPIVVVSESDLRQVLQGANLMAMLRAKYEGIRLDLKVARTNRGHKE